VDRHGTDFAGHSLTDSAKSRNVTCGRAPAISIAAVHRRIRPRRRSNRLFATARLPEFQVKWRAHRLGAPHQESPIFLTLWQAMTSVERLINRHKRLAANRFVAVV
jgi:hypothetical protein